MGPVNIGNVANGGNAGCLTAGACGAAPPTSSGLNPRMMPRMIGFIYFQILLERVVFLI
jgi:hypothetical protein